MTFRSGIGKSVLCCLFTAILSGFAGGSGAAIADEAGADEAAQSSTATDDAATPALTPQEKLKKLGADFASKIGEDLNSVDTYLAGAGKAAPARTPAASSLATTAADSSPPRVLPPLAPEDLNKLGADFESKIGEDLGSVDLYLAGAGKVELAEHVSGTILPDDEPLLLHIVAGKESVGLPQDIYSVKHDKRLMISLGDFCTATGFAIRVNTEKGTAAGWFISKDQTFSLDAQNDEVTIKDKTMAINPKDIEVLPNDILISSDLLEKWFALDFSYDFSALSLIVKAAQPLPSEAAYLRSQKGKNAAFVEGPPRLPYKEQPYGIVSVPYIDANIGGNLSHSPGNPPQKSGNWSTIMSGDLLGFNAQAFASGGVQKPYFNSLSGSLGKVDPEGGLLGPLHATSYSFGDIGTVSSSLIGGGAQESGITATNKPINANTSATQTIIRGYAQSGWDVELYRNDSYLDIRHIGGNGIYDFGNVDLLGGDNDFKLVFYGPQGEMHEEHQHVGVNPISVGKSHGYYAGSLSRSGVSTFQRVYGEKPATNPPGYGGQRINATYEYGLGQLGTATFGARTTDDHGTYSSYGQAGLATYFLGTYLNGDAAYEFDNDAKSELLTLRRNFWKQAMVLQYTKRSRNYSAAPIPLTFTIDKFNIQKSPPTGGVRDSMRASFSGPLAGKLLLFNRLNYNLGGTRTIMYDGGRQDTVNGSLTTSITAVSFSGSLNFNRNIDVKGNIVDSEGLGMNSRGPLLGGIWRLQSQYGIKPVKGFSDYNLEYDHSITPSLDSTTTIDFTPNPRTTAATVALNWQTSKASISPGFSYDNAHNATASVNVHFGAGADPYSQVYTMYNAYITSAGGVAARVFLDNNGDGIYDDGDTLMPEVELKALQSHHSATTDRNGIAFIPDLPQNILTDVAVDQATFTDPYDMTLYKGVSIRPHPGGITRLEFPVVVGGQMDGQANYTDAKKGPQPARNLTVSLIAVDGEIEKSTGAASDGYWSIDSIKPGIYWLTAETDDSMAPGYMPPRLVEFKAGGTTAFGQAVNLTPGYNIKFEFRSENPPPDGENHARVITPDDIESRKIFLDLGHFKSRLALAVAWYKFRMRSPQWAEQFSTVTPVRNTPHDAKTGDLLLTLRPKTTMTMDEAADACRNLQDMKFSCAVEIVTRYRPPLLTVAMTNGRIGGTVSLAGAFTPQVLPGIHMGLYDSEGALLMTAVTAGDGSYVFTGIHSGHYLLIVDGRDAQALHLLRPMPEFIDIGYGRSMAARHDIALNLAGNGNPVKDVPVSVRTSLGDYAAVNPALDKSAFKDKAVVLNLGSYNSRELMAVVWYRLRKRFDVVIGSAHLLVPPAESNASPKTGKNILRVLLPGYDIKDAWSRCNVLTSAGEYCAVEIMPRGLQEMSAADAAPKG